MHPLMRVREMTATDIDAVAALRVSGWRYAYAGLMPSGYLAAMSVAADAARRRRMFAEADGSVTDLVAESADGTVTGWAALGPYRPDGPHAGGEPASGGELYALYVRTDLIGTGVGRALMNHTLEAAAARGFPRLFLWVVEGNARARRFYERAGFALDGGMDTYDVEGTAVPMVRYVSENVSGAA